MTAPLPEHPPVEPTEHAPRVTPVAMEDIRPEWMSILSRIPGDGLKGKGFPRYVLGTIMLDPDTTGPFLDYWVTCKTKMALTVREQELVILRMGCLYRSNYVWKHHVLVGREFGITEEEMGAIEEARYEGFIAREESLLALTDELVDARTIRADVWERYRGPLKDRELVDLVSLVSQYVLFALMNNAMQVQIEEALSEIPGLHPT